ncbi:MAG: hypothetical protein V1837_03100 [Candidatus Woesearchaeota archaeon]
MIRISNNTIAAVAVVFVIIGFYINVRIYQEASAPTRLTGKASDFSEALLNLCINVPPQLNINCPKNFTAFYYYFCRANATDPHNDTITYFDDSTMFDIDPITGVIYFTASNANTGRQTVNITADDSSICSNRLTTKSLNITIIKNLPPNITGYYPNQSVYSKFPKVNISENKTLRFKVSFFETLNETVSLQWRVNGQTRNSTANATGSSRYALNTNFTSVGIFNVSIMLSDQFNNTRMLNWTVNITNVNRPPRFIRNLEPQTWFVNQIRAAFYLNDFVFDPDRDDHLYFNVVYLNPLHVIKADIYPTSNNFVVFSQPQGWIGNELVYFTVTDNWGASNRSNNVSLRVTTPPPIVPAAAGGGGGGGGGSIKCVEEWFCQRWDGCLENGTMYRNCIDLNNCNTIKKRPSISQPCKGIPQCIDGVWNRNEEGVDCGGPCQPCATCYDRVKNQEEAGIDCGGPCEPCLAQPGGAGEAVIATEQPISIETLQEAFTGWSIILISLLTMAILVGIMISKPYVTKVLEKHRTSQNLAQLMKLTFRTETTTYEEVLAQLDSIDVRHPKEGIKELGSATKQFFKAMLRLDYEFTYEEIAVELRKRRVDPKLQGIAESLLRRIKEIEYSNYVVSSEELANLIEELRRIIKQSTDMRIIQNKTSWKIEGKSRQMFELIYNVFEAMHKNDQQAAVRGYKQVMKLYKVLSEQDQRQYFAAVRRLYDELHKSTKEKK